QVAAASSMCRSEARNSRKHFSPAGSGHRTQNDGPPDATRQRSQTERAYILGGMAAQLLLIRSPPPATERRPPPRRRPGVMGHLWSDTRNKPTRLQLRRFQHRLFVAEERQTQFGSSKRRRPVRLRLEGQLWMRQRRFTTPLPNRRSSSSSNWMRASLRNAGLPSRT